MVMPRAQTAQQQGVMDAVSPLWHDCKIERQVLWPLRSAVENEVCLRRMW